MNRKLSTTAIVLATAVLHGCYVPINIRTTPNGATVYADGQPLGMTPLEIDPEAIFPRKLTGYQWESSGTLSFERVGCQPKSINVDNELLKESIRVKLDCEPGAAALSPAASPAAQPASGTAERLQELENLRENGLITDQEYDSLRRRVLDRF